MNERRTIVYVMRPEAPPPPPPPPLQPTAKKDDVMGLWVATVIAFFVGMVLGAIVNSQPPPPGKPGPTLPSPANPPVYTSR